MRVPLLEGRNFTDADNDKATRVAIVNQTMAHRLWSNQNAIGKRFIVKSNGEGPIEVVGIVRDGQYLFFSPDPQPYFFVPLAQRYTPFRYLEVRSALTPELLVKEVEDRIHTLAPDLPIIDARTMQDTVHGLAGLFIIRLAAALAVAMGILGLILAVVGVYGVVSYTAAQRTREIGVRMALGAERSDILKLVFKEGVAPVIVGVSIGIAVAAMLTRAMTKLLIGVSATDPLTYAMVVTLLSTVALLACWLPAQSNSCGSDSGATERVARGVCSHITERCCGDPRIPNRVLPLDQWPVANFGRLPFFGYPARSCFSISPSRSSLLSAEGEECVIDGNGFKVFQASMDRPMC